MENNEIVLFRAKDGAVSLPVRMDADTVWLTRMQMADLFGVTPQNITIHLKNVYSAGELDRSATSKDFLLVQDEGGRDITRSVNCYNLDAIISVGYRVNSARATQFRIWATSVLKEYLLRGYAVNRERIRQLGLTVEVMKRVANSPSIPRHRKRLRTCCISSRRTTASRTATNASQPGCSFISSSAIVSSCAKTDRSASPTTRLLHLR